MVNEHTESPQAKEAGIFAKYLEDRRVLICDPSAASRSGLYKSFQDMGAKPNLLTLVNTFDAALEAINEFKPHVVVAEYELGKRCGLELLQSQREGRPAAANECLFVVVTGNTSQTAVARAAEEDIDAYILKPYTMESVRKTVLQAALRKLNPPEYAVAIRAGKDLIQAGQLAEAEACLRKAIKMDATPSLAFYYLGQLMQRRQSLDQSRECFEKGLAYNRIHYKCLVGLYDLLMLENKHREAYEVIKKISQYFPPNAKRLTDVLRLAVVTAKYEDIEKYYAVFTGIDDRNEQLIRYVCAALIVCGKYYLNSGTGNSRAIELFRKAAITGQARINILKEIILALSEFKLAQDAREFIERFPPETHSGLDYAFMRFVITHAEGNPDETINQGRALMSRGLADERLYTVLLEVGRERKLSKMSINEILSRAVAAVPDKRAEFEALAGSTSPTTKS